MKNFNRLNLDIVPINGVDKDVTCSKCPSACCRKGMAIPLSRAEHRSMQAAGTDMRELPVDVRGRRRVFGRKLYLLASDCGNLGVAEDGTTFCSVYAQQEFPRACGEFAMGGYGCVSTQLSRIVHGEDTLEISVR